MHHMTQKPAALFGIEFPLFAFSHCRDVVVAVSKAGGLGVFGALHYTPEQLREELRWIEAHVDGHPYGIDLVMPEKFVRGCRQMVREFRESLADALVRIADGGI